MELKTLLSAETYTRFKDEAARRHLIIEELVRDVIETFIHELDSHDSQDLSDEQILDNLRDALADVKAGRVRPAREVMAELRRKYGDD